MGPDHTRKTRSVQFMSDVLVAHVPLVVIASYTTVNLCNGLKLVWLCYVLTYGVSWSVRWRLFWLSNHCLMGMLVIWRLLEGSIGSIWVIGWYYIWKCFGDLLGGHYLVYTTFLGELRVTYLSRLTETCLRD